MVEFSCDFEIREVVVVGIDDGFVRVSYKVWSPGCESMDNGEKFFVVYVPISLRGVERSGKESDGMELAFLIPLLKDSANSIGGGIAVDHELIFKSGLSQNRGSANSVYKGVERHLMFIIPIEFPPFCAESDECIERCS